MTAHDEEFDDEEYKEMARRFTQKIKEARALELEPQVFLVESVLRPGMPTVLVPQVMESTGGYPPRNEDPVWPGVWTMYMCGDGNMIVVPICFH